MVAQSLTNVSRIASAFSIFWAATLDLIDEYYGFAFLKKIPIAEDDLDKLHTNFEIISVVFNICFYHIDQMVTVSTQQHV